MAKNQTIELARNIIAELDKEIKSKKGVIEMIKVMDKHTPEIKEEFIQDWEDNLKTLEKLRDFVIYKA
jgi:hypothetical protein